MDLNSRSLRPSQGYAKNEYTFGIEEEYFVTRQGSRNTCRHVPTGFSETCRRELPNSFEREMLQSQIEVATPPCTDFEAALRALASYRQTLAHIAGRYDLSILAAGTHPKAVWSSQRATDKPRYRRLMDDLQMIGARNMVCGLHVHVALPEPDRRVDLMVRIIPFVPLLLALSTSSPFWQARRTGLMGYRLAAYDELPRTGLPDLFNSAGDYERYVDIMVAAHAIENSSFVWWAVRPSQRYPTLELRVADSCTRVEGFDRHRGTLSLSRALPGSRSND